MKPAGLLIFIAAVCAAQPTLSPAERPVSHTDANSITAHAQLLEKAKQGRIDIYFEDDSITRRLGRHRLPGTACELEAELLRLECRGLRMGC